MVSKYEKSVAGGAGVGTVPSEVSTARSNDLVSTLSTLNKRQAVSLFKAGGSAPLFAKPPPTGGGTGPSPAGGGGVGTVRADGVDLVGQTLRLSGGLPVTDASGAIIGIHAQEVKVTSASGSTVQLDFTYGGVATTMTASTAWIRLNSAVAPSSHPIVIARAAIGGPLYDAIKKLPASRTLPSGSICVAEVHGVLVGAGQDVSNLPADQSSSHMSLVVMIGALGTALSVAHATILIIDV